MNLEETLQDYTVDITVLNHIIKVVTNFNDYCYCHSDTLALEKLNMTLMSYNFTQKHLYKRDNIFNTITTLISEDINKKKSDKTDNLYNDVFHIYQKYEITTKNNLDFTMLEKKSHLYRESNTYNNINTQKNLLFNINQVYNIIVNEIKKINQNMDYKHYINPINDNIYNLNTFLYIVKDKNPIELKITLDPKLYPFIPPKVEFITQTIKLPLILSLINVDILKLKNWNSTISLEWLILEFVKALQPIIHNYILDKKSEYFEWDTMMIQLQSLTKTNNIENIFNIKPSIIVKTEKKDTQYWTAGVGYGYGNNMDWDILNYVKETELNNMELILLLNKINIYMKTNTNVDMTIIINYITNMLKGLSLLELEKNIELYNTIFDILNSIKTVNIVLDANNITMYINNIIEEMKLFNNTLYESHEIYKKINDMYIYFKSSQIVNILDNKQNFVEKQNFIKEYEDVMKKLQFNEYNVDNSHLFYSKVNDKSTTKAMLRMISEISSFKSNMPLQWDSSIWVRYSKQHNNVFSFFISGPKDTPYENGIFEFHASFPTNYPQSEPQVLLKTTGNNTVRFNPNLYNNGKVCLSLLGTWSGQENEKWNPKTSTFIQVIVSIQSLILVEQPYFNEPGFERYINTLEGKKLSDSYNIPLQIATIKYAINDMILNPPNGMEEVIKQHFKFKKDDIINTTSKWLYDLRNNNNIELNEFETVYKEMLDILNKKN